MILRTGHLLLRLCAGLVAGLIVLVLLIGLRLERGPVRVDFLAPMLASALGGSSADASVTVDHASIGFDNGPKLALLAQGVHLKTQGGPVLTLPEAAVDLSLRALISGVIAPTRIVLIDPVMRLERDAGGSLRLGLGNGDAEVSEDWTLALVQDLAGPNDPNTPFGELNEVVIRRARLVVDDHSLGVAWRAEDAELTLHRDADGLRGDISLAVAAGGQISHLGMTIAYRRRENRLMAVVNFKQLRLADWAKTVPALAPLAAVDLPLSGTVQATLDPARIAITSISIDLALGAGSLRQGTLPAGAIAIAGGSVAGSYAPAAGRIDLSRLSLDLGGPQIAVSGTIDGIGANLLAGAVPDAFDAALSIKAQALPVDDFPRYWPEKFGVLTRSWIIEHVHEGIIDRLDAQLQGHLDLTPDASRPLTIAQLTGTAAYRHVAVDYFKPLPPAREIDGTAIFNRTSVEFTPSSGSLLGIRIARGLVRLYRLDTHDEQVAIDLQAQGPVKDALAVLDHEPLHYARALSIDPDRVAGDFKADVTFALPLDHTLQFSQVVFGAQASLTGVAVGKALFGHDLANGQLTLRLDTKAMRLDGTAAVAGVPVNLDWTQSLVAADEIRTRYTLRGQLDDAMRHTLGLDFFPDLLTGSVGFNLDYAVAPEGAAQATLALDLGAATLTLSKLAWTKPKGTAATARLDMSLQGDRLLRIDQASIRGGGLDAQAAASFAAGGKPELTALTVRHLTLGRTHVAGTLARRPEGGWLLRLSGAGFDASGLMDEIDQGPQPAAPEPPLIINAKLDRLYLGDNRQAQNVAGELYSDGVHWEAASIDAALTGGGALRLRFGTVAGSRKLNLTTDDFGGLLSLLNLSDNIRGGRFQFEGTAVDDGSQRVLKGRANGQDYRLVGAPLFARLLSLASFSGIGALLRGEGIPFSQLSGDIVYREDRVSVANLRAYGGAIGVNASGIYNKQAGTIDVSGTLVPAYRLNSIIGNLPVLGNLLLGGEGEGIFGANFRVAGPLANPNLSVNALSALAPGFLRNLFLFDPGNPTPAPAAEAAKPGG